MQAFFLPAIENKQTLKLKLIKGLEKNWPLISFINLISVFFSPFLISLINCKVNLFLEFIIGPAKNNGKMFTSLFKEWLVLIILTHIFWITEL